MTKREHIHCVGIGGIGVSALARLYRSRGLIVSGSDLARSEITDTLVKEGIRVFIGPHKAANVARDVTTVIHTAAAPHSNPELREARKRGIALKSYAEAIGELTREYQTVAIAGAHGKSTTTALTALMLERGGYDPTVIVGTKLREFAGSNFRRGDSPYLVLEADEYRTSFTNYTPFIAVVTNIDREHLDFYKNISRIKLAFEQFLSGLRPGGVLVLNSENRPLREIGKRLERERRMPIVWYSLRDRSAARIKKALQIPGKHNLSNAIAAFTVGRLFNIPEPVIFSSLHSYRGAWRRFDYQGIFAGAKLFADYAHHPTEIAATIQGARERFPRAKIWCVFQPHHYERTRDLFPEFTKAFDKADEVIMLDIYEVAGRERKNHSSKINSERLSNAIARRGVHSQYLPDPAKLSTLLHANVARGDVVLMMGAGTIWEMTRDVMKARPPMQRGHMKRKRHERKRKN